MSVLNSKNILIGVTGGIAAYKVAALVSALKKTGANVKVIMTESAQKFISPLTFEALSGNRAYIDLFDAHYNWEIEHISLAKWADMIVVAPCTANMIAKYACGIADDLLSTVLAASRCKVMFAPAMNTQMYENSANIHNIEILRKRGVLFAESNSGMLACGDTGKGRMAEPEQILSHIISFFEQKQDMAGMKIIVTAGPTREYIDPVRFISNPSTGKMGYAIAKVCAERGAVVTLVSGPVNIESPHGVELIKVETVQQMCDAVLSKYDDCDMVFKAAAVGDFKPTAYSCTKIKKCASGFTLELEGNTDILKLLGSKKKSQFLCGFAAETDDIAENAMKKIQSKNLDMIFVNDVRGRDTGFAKDTNGGMIIKKDATVINVEVADKNDVARVIVDAALQSSGRIN